MNRDSSFPGVEVSPLGDLHTSPPTASAVAHPPALPATVPADELSAHVRDGNGPAVASGVGARVAASVWVLPAAKLVGFCCVLTCIAWLGERSRDTTVYGPELAESTSPEATLPKPAPAPMGEPGGAPASAPPPPVPPPPCASTSSGGQSLAPPTAVLTDGRLVLNEATAAELDRLPGIGKKRADDIVALRTRMKRFKRLEDLLRVRGIGPRSLTSLKEHLVLDRPKPLEDKDAGSGSDSQERTAASPPHTEAAPAERAQ